jgi:bacterioferritin-associated ferredoxin
MRIISIWETALYICICNAVTEQALKDCARDGARSVDDLAAQLGVGAGCGRCRECASEMLREACSSVVPKTIRSSPA